MHQTMTTGRLTDAEIVANFLALPAESLPSAAWKDDGLEFSGSCWPYLRDFLLPLDRQKLNHDGAVIVLSAARSSWRGGVKVRAG